MQENWSNNACLGYVILAMENLEKTESEISILVNEIKNTYNATSVDEANHHYCKCIY